jgi:hypothetical protein
MPYRFHHDVYFARRHSKTASAGSPGSAPLSMSSKSPRFGWRDSSASKTASAIVRNHRYPEVYGSRTEPDSQPCPAGETPTELVLDGFYRDSHASVAFRCGSVTVSEPTDHQGIRRSYRQPSICSSHRCRRLLQAKTGKMAGSWYTETGFWFVPPTTDRNGLRQHTPQSIGNSSKIFSNLPIDSVLTGIYANRIYALRIWADISFLTVSALVYRFFRRNHR